MSKVELVGGEVSESYTTLTIRVKFSESKKVDFYINSQPPRFGVRNSAFVTLKDLEKAITIIRGFLNDKRNYDLIMEYIRERFASVVRDYGMSPDSARYKRRVIAISILSKNLKKQMGIKETDEDIMLEMGNSIIERGVTFQ